MGDRRDEAKGERLGKWDWIDAIGSEDGPHSTTRAVLVRVGLHMDADGTGAWPSSRTLARETGLSQRCVLEHLDRAKAEGWIHWTERGEGKGYRGRNYVATVPTGLGEEAAEDLSFPARRFVGLIRSELWLSEEPPPGAPGDWTIQADLNFVRRLWSEQGGNREATAELEAFLRGSRLKADDGELQYRPTPEAAPETLEVGVGFTTALLAKRLEFDGAFYHDAVAVARKEGATASRRSGYAGRVGEMLDELAARPA